MAEPESTQPGNVRLRLQTKAEAARWVNVGPLQSLSGARALAEDLITEQVVRAVRVEHRNRGTWRPAWSFLAGLSLLLVVSAGCDEPRWVAWSKLGGEWSAIHETYSLEACNRKLAHMIS